jgi:decaprenylphospho-beta-D-erythro-pentofuranosid-2-ulose 2-reductase
MTNRPWLLILGANSDIANAIAKLYAQAGYNLYLASRNIKECEKNAADIRLRYQIEVQALAFDARNFKSHTGFYAGLAIKPQGVIVAFGIMHEQPKAQADFGLAQDMIEANYAGAVSILEIIAADFEQCQRGFIVGISSVAGDRGRQSNYIYGSTKSAFSAYLAGLRHRLIKSNVSVLTVKPGFVATKMTANLDLPAKLIKKKKSTIFVKPIWLLIMLLIIHLPNFVFHKTKL